MYAVIKTGGKQYKVSKDDIISVEKLSEDTGKKIKLNEVLIISDKGKPSVLIRPMHLLGLRRFKCRYKRFS